MHIHLVTYATPRFRLRQVLLGWSARLNHVADTMTSWTPEMLRNAGFEDRCKDIHLSERASGFWAWKPFIIDAKLREVPNGDLVFYCDVGRLYPFKLIDQPLKPYLEWMNKHDQDIMPGVLIPWHGSAAVWTRREAFIVTGMDRPEIHASIPIQASFSIWRASERSRECVAQWLDWCSQRALISDDPSSEGLEELAEFREHRHDQALLTLCCLQQEIKGLQITDRNPDIDTRHPSQVSRLIFGEQQYCPSLSGRMLRIAVRGIEWIEQGLRQIIKFDSSAS